MSEHQPQPQHVGERPGDLARSEGAAGVSAGVLSDVEWQQVTESCAWIVAGGYAPATRKAVEDVVAAREAAVVAAVTAQVREVVESVWSQHRPENSHAWCSCGWKRPGVGFPTQQHAAHVAAEVDAALA